jgi:predicted exporter
MMARAWAPLLWLGCVAFAAIIVARARYITDLSVFLPVNPTPVQQLLVDQLRDGPASRLILIAIVQGDAAARARASVALANRLRKDPQFSSVNNGAPDALQSDREFLFKHRYLLSESVTAERFSAPGLHAAISETIENLASPAGLLFKSLLPRDPTGELLNIIEQLSRSAAPETKDGVWVSADGSRCLAVAQTTASGSDSDAQARAIDAIRAAFASAVRAAPPAMSAVQLKLSGPGVFAVAARAKIERAAVRLSIASGMLVVTLLLVVYRSLPALVLGLLPVASGALIGIAAVALGFGAVHGVTLGFGATLIGESVDYSIYFFIQSHRRRGTQVAAAFRISRTQTTRRLLHLRFDRRRIGDSLRAACAAARRICDPRSDAARGGHRRGIAALTAKRRQSPHAAARWADGAVARGAVPLSSHAVESRARRAEPHLDRRTELRCEIARGSWCRRRTRSGDSFRA